jgi:hypothetical protein
MLGSSRGFKPDLQFIQTKIKIKIKQQRKREKKEKLLPEEWY